MRGNNLRTSCASVGGLLLAMMVGMAVAAPEARAQNVKLKGASAFTSGTIKAKAKGLGVCEDGVDLDVSFHDTKKKFLFLGGEEEKYKGGYKQSGPDRRKVKFNFTGGSKDKIKKEIKQFIKLCAGVDDLDIDIKSWKWTGKVNKRRDMLKIKGEVKVRGEADGDSGEAKWTFKTSGPLKLAGDIEL